MGTEGGTLREQLYAASAPPSEDVDIGGVGFRMVGLGVSDQLALSDMGEGEDATYWVLERMIRDESGERVFEDNDELLRGMRFDVVEKLTAVAMRLMDVAAQSKNSEAAHSSDG